MLDFLPDAVPEQMAETLTAFANSEGGTLVLGVSEEGHLGSIFVEDDASDALEGALHLCRPLYIQYRLICRRGRRRSCCSAAR